MNGSYLNPYSGQPLSATIDPKIFTDGRGMDFLANETGKLISLKSPTSAAPLSSNDDGTYTDTYTGEKFSYDSKRGAFIPNYIPDGTNEPATIQGDKLVGLETGRTFDIDPNGHVLTPEEISFQRNQAMSLARLEQMKADGTIDTYLDECRRKQEAARNKLEEARTNGSLDDKFRNAMNAEEVDHILLHFDEIIDDIQSQTEETLDELLQYFNSNDVHEDNNIFRSYDEPVVASRLNARYRELTGKDHPTYVQEIPSVITRYREHASSLSSYGGYFNEAYFAQLEDVYTSLITMPEDGIEPSEAQKSMAAYNSLSKVERLKKEHESFGIEMPDSYYEMMELKDKAENGEMGVNDIRNLCDIAFGKGTPLSQNMADAFILSGRVKVTEIEYSSILRNQIEHFYGTNSQAVETSYNTIMDMRRSSLRAQMYNEQMAKHGAPTEEMIADATKPELIDMRTQIYNNNPDLAYREEMREHYLSIREDGSYVVSKFDVIDGEQPVCQHSLELVSEQGKKVLQSRTFDYTEDFQHSILEPALTDYAECSPDMRASISSHLVEGVEWASADYRVISGNNNVMSVNNIPSEYAQEIANKVQQIEPVKFEAQQPLKEEQLNMGGHQYVLTKTGFATPLLLTLMLGFVLGLGMVLGFYIG